ncbi:MAG: vanadium-dependent haloperoxidase [Saprospiraceae bacterium]|nr:vanadium-dependent haloperoxidase [Saprospiraceae bacterium]
MKNIIIALGVFGLCCLLSCVNSGKKQTNVNTEYEKEVNRPAFIHASMKKLSDVIVHDIFSPPVASRNYVYTSIAAYEAGKHLDSSYTSLSGQLKDMPDIIQPEVGKVYSFGISANIALLTAAKNYIFSEDKIEVFWDEYMANLNDLNIDQQILDRSIEYGKQVAQQVIDWSNTDNYKESRSFPKFSITEDAARWKPTPPGYMEGIEPHWSTIRPFVIKNSDQFTPELPTQFSMDKNSQFYKEVIEVYEVVNNINEEEKEIASFWDCNPYVLNVTGHVMHASKKITPGGHWIGITKIACEKAEASFVQTLEAYALTSIALADGFISCWDEKYRSNLTRPETVINEHIDKDWLPTLQTPPFPEYTSGHSVISTAAAVALTSIFGENFSFKDDTELEYGLPVRNFDSFFDASAEAAVSRLYGGIHYRPAIDNGVTQGKKLGEYVIGELKFRNEK